MFPPVRPSLAVYILIFMSTFPQVTGIPKVAAEDTSLVASNIRGEKKTIPIPKGTEIVLDIAGIHYNRT